MPNFDSISGSGDYTENVGKLRIGDWEVARSWCHCGVCQQWENSPASKGEMAYGPYFVKHYCPSPPGTSVGVGSPETKDAELDRYKYSDMSGPCGCCGGVVPEEIQGLYVLLSGDMNVDT